MTVGTERPDRPRRRPLERAFPMLRPLSSRDFRLLWAGLTVSLIGDGVFLVALAWQAYQLSNVPTALSFVGAAMTLPQVFFLLLGGVVSDRLDRRRVMIGADVVRGKGKRRTSPFSGACAAHVPERRRLAPPGDERHVQSADAGLPPNQRMHKIVA